MVCSRKTGARDGCERAEYCTISIASPPPCYRYMVVSLERSAVFPYKAVNIPYRARQRPKNIKISLYKVRIRDVTVTQCCYRPAGGVSLHVTGEAIEMVQ